MSPNGAISELCTCLWLILVLRMSSAQSARCQSTVNCTQMSRNNLEPKSNPYPDRKDWNEIEWLNETDEGNQLVDLMFVVDGSSTVTTENFANMMDWIASISRGFDISRGNFRIGLVQYSHWYRTRKSNNQRDMRTEIILGSCTNSSCFENKLSGVQRIGHTTFTGFAINKTVDEDFRRSKYFHNSTKILVLMTDSTSQDPVLQSANYARQMNINLFAVGITDQANINELREISTGDSFDNFRIYMVSDFLELETITASLRSEIRSYYMRYVCPPLPLPIHGKMQCSNFNNLPSLCMLQCDYGDSMESHHNFCGVYRHAISWSHEPPVCEVCRETFDLLVILDSSSSVACERFILTKKFLIAMVDAMHIGPDTIQVAAIRYYNEVQEEFGYDKYTAKSDLIEAFRNMTYCGSGTRTGDALRFAVGTQFSTKVGKRQGIPHITLLITDGDAKDDIKSPSGNLHKISKVFAIGVRKAQLEEMQIISSPPILPILDRIYPEYDNILNATLISTLLRSFCNATRTVRNTFCKLTELSLNVSCDSARQYPGNHVPVGTTCRLPCAKGFRTAGESRALCGYSGNWSLSNFICIEKKCDSPSDTYEAVALCSDFKVDSMCSLKCRPGYDINPPADQTTCEVADDIIMSCSRTCKRRENADPYWDMHPIKCNKINICRKHACTYGTCIKQDNSYFCDCEPDYSGIFCETKIDNCNGANCHNGTCKDGINVFSCLCHKGFKGEFCEENINDCLVKPCKNGKCIDKVDDYECQCENDFTGRNCENRINECYPNPCQNNGTCEDKIGDFSCRCPSGFEGKKCENDTDECLLSYTNNCEKDTTEKCSNTLGSYECVCRDGWKGTACHLDIDECSMNVCGPEGKCHNSQGSYTCRCNNGFHGMQCDAQIDYCASVPCQNQGMCTNRGASYTCKCAPGYTGKNCQIDLDDCLKIPCMIGRGRCNRGINGFTCDCSDGFTGRRCEIAINVCYPNPCKNGRCQQDRLGSYRCICNPGFTGRNCRVDINECKVDPCPNNATCVNLEANYRCECQLGFEGRYCDQDIDECKQADNICGEHGYCKNEIGSYRCDCRLGYTGTHCDEDIDECVTSPPLCGQNGVCTNVIGSFSCACPAGYYELCNKKLCRLPVLMSKYGETRCANEKSSTKCSLSCPDGMRLKDYKRPRRVHTVSNLEIICPANNTWNQSEFLNGQLFQWECEIIKCKALNEVSESGVLPYQIITTSTHPNEGAHHIYCTNGRSIGSICNLKCHRHFSPVTKLEKECKPSGTWTNQRWNCVQRLCSPLSPNVTDGSYTCSNGLRPGSVCTVICDPGFVQDERNVGRTICDGVNGKMQWKRISAGGRICRPSECEASVDLVSLKVAGSTISFRRKLHKKVQRGKNNEGRHGICDANAIIAINVTKGEDVTMQLWYGKSIAGYHTIFSTNASTNGLDTWAQSNEYLISGVGRQLSSSGFGKSTEGNGGSASVEILSVFVVPNSLVTVTLSYNRWSWQSKGGSWGDDLQPPVNPTQTNGENWYLVHFGLNRVPNTKQYYDDFRNGTGLCNVCFTEN